MAADQLMNKSCHDYSHRIYQCGIHDHYKEGKEREGQLPIIFQSVA